MASASPRRKEILGNLGLKFTVQPSKVDENLDKSRYINRAFDYTVDTASLKAREVFRSHETDTQDENVLVIGCDTIVTFEGTIYEKPIDESDAFRILRTLSGNCHTVYSGVIFIYKDRNGSVNEESFYEATDVEFANLSDEVIEGYIRTGEPMDKAGGYGIQGKGGSLVKGIKGDYFNVMGFPSHTFSVRLTQLLNH